MVGEEKRKVTNNHLLVTFLGGRSRRSPAQMGPSITPVTVFPLRGMVCGRRVYNILTKNNLRNLNLQTPSFSGRSVV